MDAQNQCTASPAKHTIRLNAERVIRYLYSIRVADSPLLISILTSLAVQRNLNNDFITASY